MAVKIIAEAGVNHNGEIQNAYRLIDSAKFAGADAIKFQSFSSIELTAENAPKAKYQQMYADRSTQREMLARLELNEMEHQLIADYCEKIEIEFLSTAFGQSQLDLLIKLKVQAIKVASGEITHWPLLKEMAKKAYENNLDVYLSTGMSEIKEIQDALDIFIKEDISLGKIFILHCTSHYPAPYNAVNMKALRTLRNTFQCKVGYSDHTTGILTSVVAVALGAEIIEKHITLDQAMKGPDHKASLNPQEFRSMVKEIRNCEEILGQEEKTLQDCERDTRYVARRSIRASEIINKGDVLNEKNLICKRPNDGISPMNYPQILGKRAKREYEIGECID
ncbi:N-acetylneuraminate synthase [Prochlorococcus marinus]|uniref:Sialic acid synthase n=1 Tax=Prochlorococcus marinus (strain MIT 9303) TaxID=59922 RepID=A2C5V5_PROM3|nr:N-acetylneuraminate synthase [Prochlorococcus marinus]ABM76865.1 Sialic acid synthase [Prochlorococcus marinus str. MIT 9303]